MILHLLYLRRYSPSFKVFKAKKKMTLGWVVDGEKTPRWAAGGIDPPQPKTTENSYKHKKRLVE